MQSAHCICIFRSYILYIIKAERGKENDNIHRLSGRVFDRFRRHDWSRRFSCCVRDRTCAAHILYDKMAYKREAIGKGAQRAAGSGAGETKSTKFLSDVPKGWYHRNSDRGRPTKSNADRWYDAPWRSGCKRPVPQSLSTEFARDPRSRAEKAAGARACAKQNPR